MLPRPSHYFLLLPSSTTRLSLLPTHHPQGLPELLMGQARVNEVAKKLDIAEQEVATLDRQKQEIVAEAAAEMERTRSVHTQELDQFRKTYEEHVAEIVQASKEVEQVGGGGGASYRWRLRKIVLPNHHLVPNLYLTPT